MQVVELEVEHIVIPEYIPYDDLEDAYFDAIVEGTIHP